MMHDRLAILGFQPVFIDQAAMATRIADEQMHWNAIISAANLGSH
jgi:hypothetical protein